LAIAVLGPIDLSELLIRLREPPASVDEIGLELQRAVEGFDRGLRIVLSQERYAFEQRGGRTLRFALLELPSESQGFGHPTVLDVQKTELNLHLSQIRIDAQGRLILGLRLRGLTLLVEISAQERMGPDMRGVGSQRGTEMVGRLLGISLLEEDPRHQVVGLGVLRAQVQELLELCLRFLDLTPAEEGFDQRLAGHHVLGISLKGGLQSLDPLALVRFLSGEGRQLVFGCAELRIELEGLLIRGLRLWYAPKRHIG